MIYVDWDNRRLLILNDDGTLDKEIACSLGQPRDVAYHQIASSFVCPSVLHTIIILHCDTLFHDNPD
jgi:hypothetical protein